MVGTTSCAPPASLSLGRPSGPPCTGIGGGAPPNMPRDAPFTTGAALEAEGTVKDLLKRTPFGLLLSLTDALFGALPPAAHPLRNGTYGPLQNVRHELCGDEPAPAPRAVALYLVTSWLCRLRNLPRPPLTEWCASKKTEACTPLCHALLYSRTGITYDPDSERVCEIYTLTGAPARA